MFFKQKYYLGDTINLLSAKHCTKYYSVTEESFDLSFLAPLL